MANKKKFTYLTETDRNAIEQCCLKLRRSAQSRQNLFYIVANFGEFISGSVFEADSRDAGEYVQCLSDQCRQGYLKEHSCACVFFELRSFFDSTVEWNLIERNPFGGLSNPFSFPDRLSTADLPKFSEVDRLLNLCPENSDILVAVLLAFRMGLSISEIVTLKKNQFCLDEKEGKVYLKTWRMDSGEKKELFLSVPGDIAGQIQRQIHSTPSDYEFLFRSREKKPYQVRSLQHKLSLLQKDCEEPVTFSKLRSLCIYLMLLEDVPVSDICRYIGIRGDWLSRYDGIPKELIADAAEYVKLKIVK